MDHDAIARRIEDALASDRRAGPRGNDRHGGRVVSCTGARAVLTYDIPVGGLPQKLAWAVGTLITIATGVSRVVGFINRIYTADTQWRDQATNTVLVDIELVGEVIDIENGGLSFQRGIRNYPHLGAEAHRIRHADLAAIYDLGNRTGIEIGTLSQDATIPAAINIDDMLKRHFAVVGTTGVGKSSAVSILVRKAVETKKNLRVIVLDPHNEYAAAFQRDALILDASSMELPFWLFKFEEFCDAVFKGRGVSDGEKDFLRSAIVQAKAMYGAARYTTTPSSILKKGFREDADTTTADTPVPYRMLDVYALIEEELGRLEPRYNRADLRTLRSRLESLANDPRYTFLFGKAAIEDTIEPVLNKVFNLLDNRRRITVLQLAGIPSEVINSVVSVLARVSFDIAMMSGGRCEILVICEEAHRYVPHDANSGFFPTRQSIARIAKEGRKYGCYLGVITQRPGELDPTILSQCSTVFAMRLANERDQAIIKSAIPDSSAGIIEFISSIGRREAIAFGEAVATPMRMMFEEVTQDALPSTAWLDGGIGDPGFVDVRSIVGRMRGTSSGDLGGGYLPQSDQPRSEPAPDPMPQPQIPLRANVHRVTAAFSPPNASESWPSSTPKGFGRL